ncbi:head-tail joining protein [Maridesulfovibrio sp.]|uniref:head-tail joining protein n=1 Tax=unclassified Maridesulfovibrio TaxID=2794999 RepID=UPI003B00197F
MSIHDDLDIFFKGLDAVEIAVIGEDHTFTAYKNTDMDSVTLGRAMVFNPDQPMLTCKEVDASGLNRSDQVVMEDKIYDVLDFTADGTGLGELELMLAQEEE